MDCVLHHDKTKQFMTKYFVNAISPIITIACAHYSYNVLAYISFLGKYNDNNERNLNSIKIVREVYTPILSSMKFGGKRIPDDHKDKMKTANIFIRNEKELTLNELDLKYDNDRFQLGRRDDPIYELNYEL